MPGFVVAVVWSQNRLCVFGFITSVVLALTRWFGHWWGVCALDVLLFLFLATSAFIWFIQVRWLRVLLILHPDGIRGTLLYLETFLLVLECRRLLLQTIVVMIADGIVNWWPSWWLNCICSLTWSHSSITGRRDRVEGFIITIILGSCPCQDSLICRCLVVPLFIPFENDWSQFVLQLNDFLIDLISFLLGHSALFSPVTLLFLTFSNIFPLLLHLLFKAEVLLSHAFNLSIKLIELIIKLIIVFFTLLL